MTPRASLLQQVETAWKEAEIEVCITDPGDRVAAHVDGRQLEAASAIAVRTLQRFGCRTGVHRSNAAVSSVQGFSESASLCIDIMSGSQSPSISWRRRKAPCVALLGPDGVGKSTALRLVKEWFAREAPFVDLTVRQWRPGLLPPLANLFGKGGDENGDQRPRRHKGNLQWFRLFYYFLDFLLGSWWKDRERIAGSRLIVYDRCALDMEVDPYRFALSSRRGTRLLWKLTPRPEKLILLFDTPGRIASRKDDLREHEMAEQLERWLRLASEDEVHAVIRVDAGPREIANRVRDLFIDSLAATGNSTPPATALPPGKHALLRGQFLIPLDNRKIAAASLDIYNPQRRIAKIAKVLLRCGLRAGIAQPFLRPRVGLGTLRRAVNSDEVSLAVSLGTAGPNQKPTIQIMDRAGTIQGYAKVGRHPRSIASLLNEEQALRKLHTARFSTAAIPRLLNASWIGNSYVLVQSTCRSAHESRSIVPDERHIHFLVELHGLNPSYSGLPFPGEAGLAQLRHGGFHYYAHLIDLATQRWSGNAAISCGPGHGDFTPWNIRSDDKKLFVFDWETFNESTPAGWDLFHLLVAGAVEVQGTKPGVIYTEVANPGAKRELIEEYFRQIGSSAAWIVPSFVSYAAHSLSASVLDLGQDAGEKDRALQRTWAALLVLFSYLQPAPAMTPDRSIAVSI